jgi:hypothetical protein
MSECSQSRLYNNRHDAAVSAGPNKEEKGKTKERNDIPLSNIWLCLLIQLPMFLYEYHCMA